MPIDHVDGLMATLMMIRPHGAWKVENRNPLRLFWPVKTTYLQPDKGVDAIVVWATTPGFIFPLEKGERGALPFDREQKDAQRQDDIPGACAYGVSGRMG